MFLGSQLIFCLFSPRGRVFDLVRYCGQEHAVSVRPFSHSPIQVFDLLVCVRALYPVHSVCNNRVVDRIIFPSFRFRKIAEIIRVENIVIAFLYGGRDLPGNSQDIFFNVLCRYAKKFSCVHCKRLRVSAYCGVVSPKNGFCHSERVFSKVVDHTDVRRLHTIPLFIGYSGSDQTVYLIAKRERPGHIAQKFAPEALRKCKIALLVFIPILPPEQ